MRLVAATPSPNAMPAASRAVLDRISEGFLREAVGRVAVPRASGTPGNAAVRHAVIDLLTAGHRGWPDIEVDGAGNVVAGDPRRATVLVGAHYDAVPGSPGADDNASAVAVLLAAARALGPRECVCYVAFDGEECDLAGSEAFVARLGRNRLEQVHVLEMVGFTDKTPGAQRSPVPAVQAPTIGDFLGLVGTHGSRRVLDRVLACAGHSAVPVYGLYLPDLPLDAIRQAAPNVLRSDHAPFWAEGIPALMWTDTAEFRNPNYHRPTDTPDTLDFAFMAGVAEVLTLAVLSGLAAS